ncbi:RFX-type winged-helix domain-containing protein [Aphelenchoides fujianensis]|nr:RFX-type winged-helix domain-containing protein [Aphelenchoides fujianensis]
MNGTAENGEKSDEQQPNGVKADEKPEEPPVANGTAKKTKGKKRAATDDSTDADETPTKKPKTPKKKKNGHIEQKPVEAVKSPTPPAAEPAAQQSMVCIRVPNFMCEWDACTRYFHTPAAMIHHILHAHIDGDERATTPTTSVEPPAARPPAGLILCQWPGCERTPRSKWSLVTHLQDHHCNENALNAAARKRREMGDFNYVARIKQALGQEIPATNHPGYSDYAAYEAIRRHAFQHMPRDLTEDQPEGPVTKDLRLTSALILRNLAKHSAEARRRLLPYQPFMAYMAMSRLEAGVALAQCLASYSSAVSPSL